MCPQKKRLFYAYNIFQLERSLFLPILGWDNLAKNDVTLYLSFLVKIYVQDPVKYLCYYTFARNYLSFKLFFHHEIYKYFW